MKKYIYLILSFVTFLAMSNIMAQNVRVLFQDVKLPTQKVIELQSLDNLAASSNSSIITSNAAITSGATVVISSFDGQPDFARNVVLSPAGVTADFESCTITVNGTSHSNKVISEDFAVPDNASSVITGSSAFKTVTSISIPGTCETGSYGAYLSVGYGEKIGFKKCLDVAADYFHSSTNGTKDSTPATIASDDNEIEKNTFDLNGTMNGSNDFRVYFTQNYKCY